MPEAPLSGCVAFFGHDAAESTVVKRIRAFTGLGLRVLGFCFRRDKFARGFTPFWENVALGTTEDRRYGRRLAALLRALPRLWRHRAALRQADFFYARNIDMAALALAARLFAGSSAPLVYEVLDVQRVFVGTGPVAALFRWAERRILARCALLVISSPAFDTQYFRRVQGYRGRLFLLENKISFAQAKAVARPAAELPSAAPGKWVIGWFGTLRCLKSLALLCEIAAALPDKVEIYLRGVPTETGLDVFERAIAGHPNMVYAGEYRNPDDLPAIYGRVHFTWAFDFLDAGGNSDWLLPNRIYEGGYFGAVALAADGTQTGEKLRALGLGHGFAAPLAENLIAFLQHHRLADYRARRTHILSLPAETFCDRHDTRRLCETILALTPGRGARRTAALPAGGALQASGD
ncbi:MAG: succinoglycan biosynthesis glycosyltransferase ExoL [Kiloniellaceae bacterium]